MTGAPLAELIDRGWADALTDVEPRVHEIGDRLRQEAAAGRRTLPPGRQVLRAFEAPFADVRVLIVGQDPYPTPGHAVGLSFSVDAHVRPIPRSLANIYRELHADLGIPPADHGDLGAWARQGVLLLNRVLTVGAGSPASHRGWGWEDVTQRAIEALASRGGPLVAVLWGAQAQTLAPVLQAASGGSVPIVQSPHPSPLSASRGFFGSKPFSKVNELLERQGAAPIDWRIPPATDPGNAA